MYFPVTCSSPFYLVLRCCQMSFILSLPVSQFVVCVGGAYQLTSMNTVSVKEASGGKVLHYGIATGSAGRFSELSDCLLTVI